MILTKLTMFFFLPCCRILKVDERWLSESMDAAYFKTIYHLYLSAIVTIRNKTCCWKECFVIFSILFNFYGRINKMIFTEQFLDKDLFEKFFFFKREKQIKCSKIEMCFPLSLTASLISDFTHFLENKLFIIKYMI